MNKVIESQIKGKILEKTHLSYVIFSQQRRRRSVSFAVHEINLVLIFSLFNLCRNFSAHARL